MKINSWKDAGCVAGLIGGPQFVAMTFIAMFFYTGGSTFNPDAPYYDFISNSFSDLGAVTTYGGQANLMPRILFSITLFCLAACYALLFIVLPSAFSDNPVGRRWMIAASILGIQSCGFISTIPLVPGSENPYLHFPLAIGFYLSMGVATFVSAGGMWKAKAYPRTCAWLGILVLVKQ